MAEEDDLGDVEGVLRVGLAVTAGGQQPGPGREGGGHVDDVLAGGGQLLGERAAQAAGALDREAAVGSLLAPARQLAEGPGVDDEPALGHLVAGGVDGDGGVG
jgi:Zn-dependent M28 family amino/carboxypeptidase